MRGIVAGCAIAATAAVAIAAQAPRSGPSDAEVVRIQSHLAAVARALRSESTAHLSEEQRTARGIVLDWLDEYRTAGRFPHNHVRPGERVPVFVDPHGTPCAVGYLMLRSGEEELVREIVRTDNLVRVPELEDDERVAGWLHEHGLTLDEAALIQPMYDWLPPPQPPALPRVERGYRPATVGVSLASLALASYFAMSGPQSGAPWALSHTFLILRANETVADEPTWAVGLNVVGLAAIVASEAARITRRSSDREDERATVALRPHVGLGPHGTEVGFAVVH